MLDGITRITVSMGRKKDEKKKEHDSKYPLKFNNRNRPRQTEYFKSEFDRKPGEIPMISNDEAIRQEYNANNRRKARKQYQEARKARNRRVASDIVSVTNSVAKGNRMALGPAVIAGYAVGEGAKKLKKESPTIKKKIKSASRDLSKEVNSITKSAKKKGRKVYRKLKKLFN